MSGGHFEYLCYRIENAYSAEMEDVELEDLLQDFCELLHDLEWWKSGDYGEDTYRETVKKFKNKWLKQYNKEKCYDYCPHKALTEAIKQNLQTIKGLEE